MSFLKIKKNTIYLQVSNQPKLIRPLVRDAEGHWVHNIPSCNTVTPAGKKEVLRYYRQVDAEFSQWMKNNADPLWELLDQMDKFNRQGERQDFSVRPIHLLPVWDHEEQDVKIAKQGNQFFEEMVKWYDQGGDVTACDWMVYTEGNGRRVKYKTTRQDQAPFQHPDPTSLQTKCNEMMAHAMGDLRPFQTEADMIKFISAQPEPQQGQVAQGQPPQAQAQMPGYTPGGDTGVALGSVPASLPPANPMPQPAPMAAPMPQAAAAAIPQAAAPMPQPAAPMPQAAAPGYMPQPAPMAAPMPQAAPMTAPMAAPMTAPMPQAAAPVPGYTPQPPAAQTVPQPPAAQTVPQPPAEEVPNAPVQAQPVYAPPVQTQIPAPSVMPTAAVPAAPAVAPAAAAPVPTPEPAPAPAEAPVAAGGPGDTLIDFGKYNGKTLGWILENDRPYLTFLKGNKKHLLPAIEQLLGTSTVVATPAAAPAPEAQATPAAAPAPAAPAGGEEAEREQILDQLNQKFLNIPDFQGPGIAQNMLPFLQQTIGTTNFSAAPLPDLAKLNAAVDGLLNAQGA